MKVTTSINEIYSKTEVEINYKNTKETSIELIVEIPLRSEIIFDYFVAKIKDKIIKSKVIESNKAEEKYNDAIASGNTGIATMYDEENKICSVKIGNLPKKETLELKLNFIQFVNIKNDYYSLNLIKDFPKIKDFISNEFEGKIILETNSKIIELKQNNNDKEVNYNTIYSNENKKCQIEYKRDSIDKILFKTIEIEKPLLFSQYNSNLNETNYILQYYQNNNSITSNKEYPCLFIILIDQSVSMSGTKIKMVSKTLEKLIKLLPENSYYQLIGFGTFYKVYNGKPELKSEKNLENTIQIIKSLDSNLGGTDLSKPLYYILRDSYSDYKNINLSKQIIVLTDGDINVGDDIIDLIKLHNNEFSIHCIGIGNEINKDLIIKTSNAGNGTYHFISEDLLDKKIFEILKECTKEYINDYKFILDNNNKTYELQPVNKITYNKESLNFCFVQKGNENNNINVEFNWKNSDENFKKNIEFNSEKIIKLNEGCELSKLIIGFSLKYDLNEDKNEQIKLSKLYQVLCKYTSLFAEIEGDKSSDNQMQTFIKKHSVKKIRDYSFLVGSSSRERFRGISRLKMSAPYKSFDKSCYRSFTEKYMVNKNKKSFNIYFWAFLVLIILLIFYIAKRII